MRNDRSGPCSPPLTRHGGRRPRGLFGRSRSGRGFAKHHFLRPPHRQTPPAFQRACAPTHPWPAALESTSRLPKAPLASWLPAGGGTFTPHPGLPIGAGFLCLTGSPIGRYKPGRNRIQLAGDRSILLASSKTSRARLLWAAVSTSQHACPCPDCRPSQVGSTWYFQFWHRSALAGSNLSNGIGIPF